MSRTPDRNPSDRNAQKERSTAAGGPVKKIDTATEVTCANCGMTQDEWRTPEGYKDEGDTYCCEGCALGTGCTC